MARTTTTARAISPKGKATTRKARKATVILTPGQKAAATKRKLGLDLSAIAHKAHATRVANIARAERDAKRAKAKRATATKGNALTALAKQAGAKLAKRAA